MEVDQTPEIIYVKHLSGLPDSPRDGWLHLEDRGVRFVNPTAWKQREFDLGSWDEISSISFDDPGRTRADGALIALVGVLGLGSRKSFTLLTVNRSDGQAFYFENPREIGHWRSRGRELLAERPALERVLSIAGFSEPTEAMPAGLAGQLGRLAELHAQGALSDEEFAAAKAAVLQQVR